MYADGNGIWLVAVGTLVDGNRFTQKGIGEDIEGTEYTWR
jgi:hypothetical protein